jgi:hypothetical protein
MLDFLFGLPFILAKFIFNLAVWAGIFYYGYVFIKDTYHKYKDGHYDEYFKS